MLFEIHGGALLFHGFKWVGCAEVTDRVRASPWSLSSGWSSFRVTFFLFPTWFPATGNPWSCSNGPAFMECPGNCGKSCG